MIKSLLRYILFIAAVASCPCCMPADARAVEFRPRVIKIYDESEVDSLMKSGTEILRRRGDILLCFVPVDSAGNNRAPKINDLPEKPRQDKIGREKIRKGNGGHLNTPTLDVATGYFDADRILYGDGFGHTFTGKGVVVGLCDIGFDPLHPTFLDSDGRSRVKRLTHYKESEGIRTEMEGDEAYAAWRTDTTDEYHATHVCGILAGNGAGSPYGGIARDADIVASVSTLSDVGILAGVEDIIDYAKEAGKPCVINLSVGNYVGAHDGTSLASQYLDMCADDAIIVLSAGNEGSHTNSMYYKFTEDHPSFSFRLGSRSWDQLSMYGETDIWSGDESQLGIRLSIYDDETKQTVFSYPELTLHDDETVMLEWDPDYPDFPGLQLEGMLAVTGGIDRENGRHRIILEYKYESPQYVEGKTWARYVIRADVTGIPGADADVFADGTYTRLMGVAGNDWNPVPDTDMSISDLACGESVISVGMYGNRSTWPFTEYDSSGNMTESYAATGYSEGATVTHCSYGRLRDGRQLPLTAAPGAPIVSSLSRPYLATHPDETHLNRGSVWVAGSGTSMSSPYVAGFIATWLEADPTLSAEDVKELIALSNRHDIDEPDNPRNMNGWFDPLAAMLMLTGGNATEETPDNHDIIQPGAHMEIFTVAGTKVSGRWSGDHRHLPPGIYIIRTATGARLIRKP